LSATGRYLITSTRVLGCEEQDQRRSLIIENKIPAGKDVFLVLIESVRRMFGATGATTDAMVPQLVVNVSNTHTKQTLTI
jgi:hypothetical protein